MTPEQFQTLFEYHYAAHERIWDCVRGLAPERFLEPSDYSFGSIRNQLAHCMIVDIRWLARLQGEMPPELAFDEYPDASALRQAWIAVRKQFMAYIKDLTPADLNEFINLDFPGRYGRKRNPRWQILLHVINHGTDHRAQILARLHELGAPTFEQDLMLQLWSGD